MKSSFNMDVDLHRSLKAFAAMNGMSVGKLIEALVRKHLEDNKWPIKSK